MMKIQDIIVQKPYLVWYVKDPSKLSDESILEHVLNNGDWVDVQQYFQMKGLQETAKIFFQTIHRKRSNYLPEIQQFFSRYFLYHAS